MGAVAAGILTCIVGMVIFRDATAGSRARFFGSPTRLALPFTAADDYESVVGRIGYPGIHPLAPLARRQRILSCCAIPIADSR